MAFGVFGVIPLYVVRRKIKRLEALTPHTTPALVTEGGPLDALGDRVRRRVLRVGVGERVHEGAAQVLGRGDRRAVAGAGAGLEPVDRALVLPAGQARAVGGALDVRGNREHLPQLRFGHDLPRRREP
ncbi:hypothetical protein GCM10023238_03810 [Streptomyces heliomycini]